MAGQVTEDFILELIKVCLRDKQMFEVVREHMKYTFLPQEAYKKIWKSMVITYNASTPNKMPSFGILSQQHSSDLEVLEILNDIKQIDSPDKKDVLDQFEIFVKQSLFVEAYDKLGDLYNEGEKDKAFDLMNNVSEKIAAFSLKSQCFEEVFGGFEPRHQKRQIAKSKGSLILQKVPFGIPVLDKVTKGGIPETDTVLFLAQSGVGKTKLLRWIGVQSAIRGYKVLHVQLEGSKEECYDGYDATWGGLNMFHIEACDIPDKTLETMKKTARDFKKTSGEIYVEAYETFDSATCVDVRNSLIEVEKAYGHIDMVLIDYMELLEPGDGKHYSPTQERFRREAIGKYLKNIAIEFKTRVVTATQASSVSPELLNRPTFFMTRFNVSEFKNVVAPFSFFITLNQTADEKENGFMRLYGDKYRKVKSGQLMKIATDYDNERFYVESPEEGIVKIDKDDKNGKKRKDTEESDHN